MRIAPYDSKVPALTVGDARPHKFKEKQRQHVLLPPQPTSQKIIKQNNKQTRMRITQAVLSGRPLGRPLTLRARVQPAREKATCARKTSLPSEPARMACSHKTQILRSTAPKLRKAGCQGTTSLVHGTSLALASRGLDLQPISPLQVQHSRRIAGSIKNLAKRRVLTLR